jgi:hypothetical protein
VPPASDAHVHSAMRKAAGHRSPFATSPVSPTRLGAYTLVGECTSKARTGSHVNELCCAAEIIDAQLMWRLQRQRKVVFLDIVVRIAE